VRSRRMGGCVGLDGFEGLSCELKLLLPIYYLCAELRVCVFCFFLFSFFFFFLASLSMVVW